MADTHKVVKGDTLWGIAQTYLGSGTKWPQLATLNGIPKSNPTIYVGQIIKLKNDGSGAPSEVVNSNKAEIKLFGLQSDTDNTLFATWTWSKANDHTASYKVLWRYATGDGVSFVGSNSSISVDKDSPSIACQSTYSIPSNATKVTVKVKPISETYKKNNVDTSYWEAEWSEEKTYLVADPPEKPSSPSVSIEKYTLTAELDNLSGDATHIEFQVNKDHSASAYAGGSAATVKIVANHAAYSCTVDAGGEYKVRCRGVRDGEYGEWSDYSSVVTTIPDTPSKITVCRAESETSVYLEWTASKTAETYTIEYATDKSHFDISDQPQDTQTTDSSPKYLVTGLEPGQQYFFRVCAVGNQGKSGWTDPVSIVIGEPPAAPTTWSSSSTVITGEELTLYWVHNSVDDSSQTLADLELYVNGQKLTYTIKNTTDEAEKDKTSSFVVDTSDYIEGTKIEWRVRTAGITKEYGEWSVQRVVNIYAPPTLSLQVTDVEENPIEVLTAFPFYIYAVPGPNTQIPISYHLSIISTEIYETVDSLGNPRTVSAGEEVYSKYFDIAEALLVECSASNLDLENNVKYTVKCTVAMNSGLTATASKDFKVTWTDVGYAPNAEISINRDTFTASIRPYCESRVRTYYKVEYANSKYSIAIDEETGQKVSINAVYGAPVTNRKKEPVYTVTDEQVYEGMTADGEEIYYCTIDTATLVEDVVLSVYRRQFDGTFVELATGIENTSYTTITDPHPALDYARYRIVAITKSTGAVCYYDLPGYPIGGISVVVQWDEAWSNFETTNEDALAQPTWAGSMVQIPYNIDVSESTDPDVTLVQYIGRNHPVTYYGTQKGETTKWTMEIPKSDKETVHALRRLARWMGDVYVREPSGIGYWANVKVSLDQKHTATSIPVSMDIKRVEGGV